ncbi:hypothetical protein HRS9139_05382 [Pyrenophora teres f. teres]|nr:hypothetical protein HRS9139_05382 [Pyrenophora teres f. teres]
MFMKMEDADQPDDSDRHEYLDMGWAHEELIPFLEEVFTGSEGMPTSTWERMVLFARFNLDRIPLHEDFPSTIERLRLCLINASLLTPYELNKFMRIASMGPQMCVRIFVRHAIRHGPYRLHSLGNGPNPCYPRPQEDGTERAAVVVIPKPAKPDVVKKLEAEVKALTLKLEKYESEKKQSQKSQSQKNQHRQNQNQKNQNSGVYNNNGNHQGRPLKSQRTMAAGQDRRPPQHPGRYNLPPGHSYNQYPGMYKPTGAPMVVPHLYNPAFIQPYPDPLSMYDNSPQPYMSMPHYQQQTLQDRQCQVFAGPAPPAPVPTQALHEGNNDQMAYSPVQSSFPTELSTRLQRLQLQQTRSCPQEVQSSSTSNEEQPTYLR